MRTRLPRHPGGRLRRVSPARARLSESASRTGRAKGGGSQAGPPTSRTMSGARLHPWACAPASPGGPRPPPSLPQPMIRGPPVQNTRPTLGHPRHGTVSSQGAALSPRSSGLSRPRTQSPHLDAWVKAWSSEQGSGREEAQGCVAAATGLQGDPHVPGFMGKGQEACVPPGWPGSLRRRLLVPLSQASVCQQERSQVCGEGTDRCCQQSSFT